MSKLDFLGDVYLDKAYDVDLNLNDFIFNLEFPLSTSGIPAKDKINLGMDTSYIFETFKKFPIAVNLANNHIMDFGEESFQDTIEYLEKHKIKYFGAGNKNNNFNNPFIVNINNKNIALLGYSCPTTSAVFGDEVSNGSAVLDEEDVLNDIRTCKENNDFIVINLHWGDEEIIYPKPSDVVKARKFIDAGADLIIGHHAHVIQSHEMYKGKSIYYGIGNCIFPDFDLPSNFDGEKFQSRSSKKQAIKNKQTIVVHLDETLNVSHDTASLNGINLKYDKVAVPQWIPKTLKQYNIYYALWAKSRMIKGFIKNPRIPSFKQLKLFLGANK